MAMNMIDFDQRGGALYTDHGLAVEPFDTIGDALNWQHGDPRWPARPWHTMVVALPRLASS
jgi:hypothetical protein